MLGLLASMCSSSAKPEPSSLFGDHAVLQRNCPVPVWGSADPGEVVRVTFGDSSVQATTDAHGHWRVTLPAMKAGDSGELVISSDQGSVTSHDILVGDVWLCAGQSNMERPVRLADNLEQEKATADFTQIRHFKVIPRPSSTPQYEPKGKWVVCSPDTVERFTAIGYFFARELFNENHIPQGLINCTKGGTRIESWISPEGLATDDSLAVVTERWDRAAAAYPQKAEAYNQELAAWKQAKAEAEQTGVPFKNKQPRKPDGEPGSIRMPFSLYNGMAYPVLEYAVRAVIWYQGESNWQYPQEYAALLRGLIHGWRQRARNENLPFIIVQLPPFGTDDTSRWPVLREGQARTVEDTSHTSLVVTIDLCDGTEVHPTNKQAFADRALRVIRADIFGEDIRSHGPRIIAATPDGDAMLVQVASEGNLVLLDSPDTWGAFELAGADHVFHPAQASLQGNRIRVSSAEVAEPVALRYAWRAGPHPILFDESGLPAAPFRTDAWSAQ